MPFVSLDFDAAIKLAKYSAIQHFTETTWAQGLVREMEPITVIEVGSYGGGTLAWWAECLPKLLIGIDNEGRPNRDVIVQMLDGVLKAQEGGIGCFDVVGNSHDVDTFERVVGILDNNGGLEVDVLHIDAGHSYEEVREDWLTWKELVRPGGLVLFHDVAVSNEHPGQMVYKLIEDLVEEGRDVQTFIEPEMTIFAKGYGAVRV
jgi:cephalosporin hydroxylase